MGFKKTLTSLIILVVFLISFVSATQVCQVYDDFESGTANKWMNQNGNWTVVNDNVNYVYRQSEFIGGGSHWMGAVADFYGEDYSAEVDMRYTEMGDFGMALSIYSDSDHVVTPSIDEYLSLALFPKYNQVSLYVKESGVGVREYAYPISLEQNRWYHVRIEVENGLINVFLDDQRIISNISTNLKEGYLSLSTDDLKADFDNVILCQEQAEPPQPDLGERVRVLEEKVENLTARLNILETLVNKILGWFWFMPNAIKKDILCNALEETGQKEIVEFGMKCEMKDLKKKDVCVCRKV